MILRFLRTDDPRLHQPSHIGVVARYPANLAVADQVEPRVADMHVIECVALRIPVRTPDDRRSRAGGSHAPQFRMGKAVLPNILVGRLQSLDQRLLRVVAAKVAIHCQQRFHRQPACFLTALVAAHAVRDHRQPSLAQEQPVVLRFPIAERILVIGALAAQVGLHRYFNSVANLHPATTLLAELTDLGSGCLHGQTQNYTGCGAERSNIMPAVTKSKCANGDGERQSYAVPSTITSCPIQRPIASPVQCPINPCLLRRSPQLPPSRSFSRVSRSRNFTSATNSERLSAIFRLPALC